MSKTEVFWYIFEHPKNASLNMFRYKTSMFHNSCFLCWYEGSIADIVIIKLRILFFLIISLLPRRWGEGVSFVISYLLLPIFVLLISVQLSVESGRKYSCCDKGFRSVIFTQMLSKFWTSISI